MEPKTARVVEEHKTQYILRTPDTEYTAVIRGKILLNGKKDFPKVGDYVEYAELGGDQAVIENILPRKNQIIRKAAIGNEPQVIVTNVDVMFIVMGLDGDYNLRRLERYLLLAEQSNVKPVVVLNKMDVVPDVQPFLDEVRAVAHDAAIHAVSASTELNMEVLKTYFTPETTAVMLGSSGAGKSTMMNWFLGHNKQATQEVREDDGKGRHTTTSRELFALPGGGYLIDTPGMRTLGLFNTGDPTNDTFGDIEALLKECKYSDCDHTKSRGCAIQNAIYDGIIDAKHYASYCKLKGEQDYLKTKIGVNSNAEHKEKVKKIQKQNRRLLDKEEE
ncbi:MAG: GTPase RsgA [Candidatus Nomurabacteria bacterium]|nr:GTPase RsgA [Candidatus Nomurabacteria bacterium]